MHEARNILPKRLKFFFDFVLCLVYHYCVYSVVVLFSVRYNQRLSGSTRYKIMESNAKSAMSRITRCQSKAGDVTTRHGEEMGEAPSSMLDSVQLSSILQ